MPAAIVLVSVEGHKTGSREVVVEVVGGGIVVQVIGVVIGVELVAKVGEALNKVEVEVAGVEKGGPATAVTMEPTAAKDSIKGC